MPRFFHILWKAFWTGFAALIIGLAILLSLARLLLPLAGGYTGEVEAWAGEVLGQPVQIESLDAAWRGLGPVLKLKEVHLQHGRESLHFDEIGIVFDLWTCARNGRFEPSVLSLVGVRLAVERLPDNRIAVHGVGSDAKVQDMPSAGLSLNWLLTKQRVELLRSEVLWRDHLAGGRWLRFVDVNLTQVNQDDRHQAQGYLQLPEALGQRVSFAGELEGDPSGKDWSARMRIQGAELHAAGWAPALLLKGLHFQGTVDFDVWAEWRKGALLKVNGSVDGTQLRLNGLQVFDDDEAAPPLDFARLGGRFSWRQAGAGWRLDVDRFNLDCGQGAWPETGFSLAVGDAERPFRDLSAGFGWLRIEGLHAIAAPFLPAAVRQKLKGLKPKGIVQSLNVEIDEDEDSGLTRMTYQAAFEAIAIDGTAAGLPLLSGLSGRLEGDEAQGRMRLDSRAVSFDAPKLFRRVLEIEQLSGDLYWQRQDDGWRLGSRELALRNADIATRTRFTLDVPAAGSPFLDLQSDFRDGDVSMARHYLPAGIMPPQVVTWLDRGLVSGRVESGALQVHGRLADFPYTEHNGKFEVVANIADAVLDYRKDWPRIEELAAELRFAGPSLFIRSSAGKILAADIISAEVDILNLRKGRLDIRGQVRGGLEQGKRFLKLSPLSAQVGDALDTINFGGRMKLGLDLQLPLTPQAPTPARTRVDVGFDDATLRISGWNVSLEQINGLLHYSDGGFSAEHIHAAVLGQPLQLSVAHPHADGPQDVVINVQGRTPAAFLQTLSPMAEPLQGEADWQARLTVPRKGVGDGTIGLTLASTLEGLAINLPEPLGKTAADSLAFNLDSRFSAQQGIYYLRLGERASMRMALSRKKDGLHFERGELHFGAGDTRLPEQPGLFLSGGLPLLVLNQQVLNRLPAIPSSYQGGLPDWFAGSEVKFDRLELYGHHFNQVDLSMRRMPDSWLIQADSEQVSGSAVLPHRVTVQNPLQLDLRHLQLAPVAKTDMDRVPDPRRLLPMRIHCRNFVFNGIDFGDMELRAQPVPDGLRVEQLSLKSEVQELALEGDWLYRDDVHRSRFELDLEGADLGKILERWGYAVAIKGGKTRAHLSAEWAGSPSQFDLALVNGKLDIKIFNGRLLEIDPGAGRIFGLIGLQTLPRRLSLDFSDLFAKGFAFDNVKGQFDISEGDANTTDLRMDGPAAFIEVSGRTGLVAQDYDQLVTVTPHLTATLPLAGILAGGPAGGAVMFLADKVLGRELGKLTQYRYQVTGTWQSPVVEKIEFKQDKARARDASE